MVVSVVKIPRIDGRLTELPLEGTSGKPGEEERQFNRAAQLIQSDWKQLRAEWRTTAKRRAKDDMRWLKLACYAILSEIQRLDQADVFKSRIREFGR